MPDELCGAILSLFFFCYFLNKSPAASVAEENLATLFCCEAPGMFCGIKIKLN